MSARRAGVGFVSSYPRPRWTLRPQPPGRVVRALERDLQLPRALCRLLAVRERTTPDAAKSFLRPRLEDLHDPALLLDSDRAADRLAAAVENGETVVVHGDYDADGIAGAALLGGWIRAAGGRAEAIVPDRTRDGYDLSNAGVDRSIALGAGVIVTVDCGITALDPVRRAAAAGVDVIVTDHHIPGPRLPDAFAILNPNRPGCAYPDKRLCGAGVAFKLGQLLSRRLGRSRDEAWDYLDLVALATIADQVELDGENRILGRYGLRALARTTRPGLNALMTGAKMAPGNAVTSEAVAFRLAPRINAAGRVGDASKALRLLLTADSGEARSLAEVVERNNSDRREIERRTTEEALARLEGAYDAATDRGVVVVGDGWHPGVIGIVASRVAERLFRPSVVIALDGDEGRGSARSIPGFDLHAAIAQCGTHLERFGGHHQAAGMDIQRDRVPAFRDAFQDVAGRRLGSMELRPVLHVDLEVALGEVDFDLHRYATYLGPHGRGNPEPLYVARAVRVAGSPRVLTGGHVKFGMVDGGSRLPAIGFGLADRLVPELTGNGPVDVAFNLIENTFRGRTTIQARVVDVRPAA